MCVSMCLDTGMVCTVGMLFVMFPCVLLAASSMVHSSMKVYCIVVCIFCVCMQTLYRYECNCGHMYAILYHYIQHQGYTSGCQYPQGGMYT